jgi:L-histidine N-alpha-methyltransferase
VRIHVHVCIDEQELQRALEDDVRRGLTARPRVLPPKYFYDEAGAALFERITALPEYYLTRVESALLCEVAPRLMADLAPEDIVELGSGSSVKTRRLLDGVDGDGRPVRYVPIDVDRPTLQAVAARLVDDYASLSVHAIVGDFERHLDCVPPPTGRRLVFFPGSTIGNLDPAARHHLLRQVRRLLASADDRFLLGVDLVKDVARLEAAYDDASGVTREFNRNILRVVNRGLGADFRPEAYRHVAFYNREASRVEMHLVAESAQEVRLGRLGLAIRLSSGESIWTESCYKFTRESTRAMLEGSGLRLEGWHVDPEQQFALVVAAPGTAASPGGSDAL